MEIINTIIETIVGTLVVRIIDSKVEVEDIITKTEGGDTILKQIISNLEVLNRTETNSLVCRTEVVTVKSQVAMLHNQLFHNNHSNLKFPSKTPNHRFPCKAQPNPNLVNRMPMLLQ